MANSSRGLLGRHRCDDRLKPQLPWGQFSAAVDTANPEMDHTVAGRRDAGHVADSLAPWITSNEVANASSGMHISFTFVDKSLTVESPCDPSTIGSR
jgi:hypothetical protein